MTDIEVKSYKKRVLPVKPQANSIYYVLPLNSNAVVVYITDINGVPIKIIDLVSTSTGVLSVTGTGVTGLPANPKVDISTFVSSQLGNQVYLSLVDGKLQVNPTTSPDSSIEVISTPTELQLQLSTTIQNVINSALQSGDNITNLTGTKVEFNTVLTDGNFLFVGDITQYTDEQAQDAVGAMVSSEFTYTDTTPLLEINTIAQTKVTNLVADLEEIRDDMVALAIAL